MSLIQVNCNINAGSEDLVKGIKNRLSKIWKESEVESITRKINIYLEKFYEKNKYINTIVFSGQKKNLLDIYVPITLIEFGNNTIYTMKDNECLQIFENHNLIMIVDTAGMGKSTLVKYISLNICEKMNINKIPIIIELRKLKEINIEQEIKKELDLVNEDISIKIIRDMLDSGEFIMFLDGYDELEDNMKGRFADVICELSSKANNNYYLMTSRDESALSGFTGFQKLEIKPFSSDEAYNLIKKYDDNGEISNQLIETLESDIKFKDIKHFLSNPLLTSLLYKAYQHKNTIPNKKYLFYEQVYEALFEDHDLTKGGGYTHKKRSGLDREDFKKVLNRLGFLCISQNKLSFTRGEIINLVEHACKALPKDKVLAKDFVYDLYHSVPLLFEEGNISQWIHKSFAEYLAACFISIDSKKQEELYRKIAFGKNNNKYKNVLDFCYDMDEIMIRKTLIKEFLNKYIEYYDSSYSNEYFNVFDKDLLELRKTMGFLNNIKIINKKIKGNEINFHNSVDFQNNKLRRITNNSIKSYSTLFYEKEYHNLADILFNKKIPIFKRILINKEYNSANYDFIYNIESNEEFYINDDVSNILNKEGYFEESTLSIIPFGDRDYYLDYVKCKLLLNEINQEIEFAEDDIFDI